VHNVVTQLGLRDSPGEQVVQTALSLAINEQTMAPKKFDAWLQDRSLKKYEVAMLKRIAKDWRIVQAAHQLPGDIKTLHALTKVGTYMFDESLAVGLINSGTTLEQAKRLR
jgi:hypothetical protein